MTEVDGVYVDDGGDNDHNGGNGSDNDIYDNYGN